MSYKYINDLETLKEIFIRIVVFQPYESDEDSFLYGATFLYKDNFSSSDHSYTDAKDFVKQIYKEIKKILDKDNLDTYSKLLDLMDWRCEPGSLLNHFNVDKKHFIDMCDVCISKKMAIHQSLDEIQESKTSLEIYEDYEIRKKALDAGATVNLSYLLKCSRDEILGLTNNNLSNNNNSRSYILKNFIDDKQVVTNFFLEGKNKFNSLKNARVRMNCQSYGPGWITEIQDIFSLFKYDINLIRNTAEDNAYFLSDLPLKIRNRIANDRKLFLNAGPQSASCASKDLLDDEEVVIKLLDTDITSFVYVSKRLRNDYKFLLKYACHKNLSSRHNYQTPLFQFIGESAFNKKIFVNKLLDHHPEAYKFISKRLKRDKNLLEKTLKTCPRNIKYAGRNIRNDKSFLLPWIKMHKWPFRDLPKKLKDDYEFCKIAVKRYPSFIKYASNRIKNDKSFLLENVFSHFTNGVSKYPYQYLSSRLRKDLDFIKKAIKSDIKECRFIPKDLRKNKKFWLDMFQKQDLTNEEIFFACHFTLRRDPDIYEKILDEKPHLAKHFSPNVLATFNYKNINKDARQEIYNIYSNSTKINDLFQQALNKKRILGP